MAASLYRLYRPGPPPLLRLLPGALEASLTSAHFQASQTAIDITNFAHVSKTS
jgi:hypothetical protein